MMGKRVMAEPVFFTVRIDDHLPANHLLRAVDALLDTAFIRRIMSPHYSLIGRPSIDPVFLRNTHAVAGASCRTYPSDLARRSRFVRTRRR